MAATGAPGVVACTVNPCGAFVTATPWLIHTFCVAGEPARMPVASLTVASVWPYSPKAARSTVPPSAYAIAWNP